MMMTLPPLNTLPEKADESSELMASFSHNICSWKNFITAVQLQPSHRFFNATFYIIPTTTNSPTKKKKKKNINSFIPPTCLHGCSILVPITAGNWRREKNRLVGIRTLLHRLVTSKSFLRLSAHGFSGTPNANTTVTCHMSLTLHTYT